MSIMLALFSEAMQHVSLNSALLGRCAQDQGINDLPLSLILHNGVLHCVGVVVAVSMLAIGTVQICFFFQRGCDCNCPIIISGTHIMYLLNSIQDI